MLNTKFSMNVSCSLLMLVKLQLCSHWTYGTVEWGLFFLKILRQKSFNNNNQTSKMKVYKLMKVISNSNSNWTFIALNLPNRKGTLRRS